MDKTTLNIKMKYNKLGKAEKCIADWLLSNPGEILPFLILQKILLPLSMHQEKAFSKLHQHLL